MFTASVVRALPPMTDEPNRRADVERRIAEHAPDERPPGGEQEAGLSAQDDDDNPMTRG